MNLLAVFQATVILACVLIIVRSFWSTGDARRTWAWANHPQTIRALARERGADTEEAFVWKIGYAGIDAAIARAVRSEIQLLVGLHYGVKHFPVRPEDELRRTYLFSLDDWTGYPDDPDLFGSASMIAEATKRRIPKEPERQLAQLRTVLDLARWVQELPAADDQATNTAQ